MVTLTAKAGVPLFVCRAEAVFWPERYLSKLLNLFSTLLLFTTFFWLTVTRQKLFNTL